MYRSEYDHARHQKKDYTDVKIAFVAAFLLFTIFSGFMTLERLKEKRECKTSTTIDGCQRVIELGPIATELDTIKQTDHSSQTISTKPGK